MRAMEISHALAPGERPGGRDGAPDKDAEELGKDREKKESARQCTRKSERMIPPSRLGTGEKEKTSRGEEQNDPLSAVAPRAGWFVKSAQDSQR